MAIPNEKLREILFLLIFINEHQEESIELIMEQLKVSKSNVLRALEKAKEISLKQSEIDELLQKITLSYEFERIQSIEKTALRIGAYEMLYGGIPPQVAISEALRLTKKFGTPAATAFINAVLDGLFKSIQGKPVNQEEIQASIDELQQNDSQ